MASIAEAFGDLGITITHRHIFEMEKLAVNFVLRKTHPLTFDGPYLGVDPIVFLPSDYNALFDVFDVHPKDVEAAIRKAPAINRSFAVISDPFNLLCMWLCHLSHIYIKDKNIRHEFIKNVLRYYHCKIFCSVVNHTFRHGTNRGIMEATIANLSKKSDIIRLESWKRVIEAHVEKMANPTERFYKPLQDASPDLAFLNVITESQTALRQKIITFAQSYYEAYKAGDAMGFSSSVSTSDEGEKILAQTASVVDSATSAMISELLNPNSFVHEISVNQIAKGISTISPRMLRTALLKINETAVIQAATPKKFDEVKQTKDGTLYIGTRALMIEIIRSMIRMIRVKRVDMSNRVEVFNKMKDAYSSSRNSDKDIIAVKNSITLLVDSFNITSSESAKASLRLAVIYYIVYRTILKMKI